MIKSTYSLTWWEYFWKLISEAELNYNSPLFFFFLVAFFVIYFVVPFKRFRKIWILVGNLVFYTWFGNEAIFIVVLTTFSAYCCARGMERVYRPYEEEKDKLPLKKQREVFQTYKKKARIWYLLALILILGVWIYVKVEKFNGVDTVTLLQDVIDRKGIIVPLGISYYTLSIVGYLTDIYFRKIKAEHNILTLFTVVTYFPHIVQGPISRYNKLIEQINDLPKFDYVRVCEGMQLMLWGYAKKIVIADRLVLYTSAVFEAPEKYAGIEILIAVVLCCIQLYADFSGCMDIVGGISEVIGIKLDKNFNQPFFAKSAQDFWARWHMTLGTWTKDYIYLPISMSTKFIKFNFNLKKKGHQKISSFIRSFVPLIAVWLFTGLWHGTGVDYVVWGLYWCALMTLSKEFTPLFKYFKERFGIDETSKYHRFFSSFRTFLLFAIGRMFTVTGSLEGCGLLWERLFYEHRLWTLFDGSLYTHGLDQKDFYVALVGMILMLFVDILHEKGICIRKRISAQPLLIRWVIYYSLIFTILIFGIYGSGFDASGFVYGAF